MEKKFDEDVENLTKTDQRCCRQATLETKLAFKVGKIRTLIRIELL